jgi:carboxymethylenebutenolidase
MAGTKITVPAGKGARFDAYLSIPERGSGPGLLLLYEMSGIGGSVRLLADTYAEEGYVVLAPDVFRRLRHGAEASEMVTAGAGSDESFDFTQTLHDTADALAALRGEPACNGKIGLLGFGIGGTLAYLAASQLLFDAAVVYCDIGIEKHLEQPSLVQCPLMVHLAGRDSEMPETARQAVRAAFSTSDSMEMYVYPVERGFYDRERRGYDAYSASTAYSRTIGMFRRTIGPRYDLDALWEEHTRYEFETRDVDATMRTMVAEPYVNHVPTMTGGRGGRELRRFYAEHFISRLPKDTRIVPISRTVGANRLVDELLLCFTHDVEIDFLLPGVKPTGRYVEIPTVAIVQFRGDKLYKENIYWDQATALIQIGLIESRGLPATGIETAHKVRDESLPANTMISQSNKSGDDDQRHNP